MHVCANPFLDSAQLISTFSIPSASLGSLDSSLKRHTALIKRMKQSMGLENRDQIIRDIESLALEKYIEEIVSASLEGCLRCKSDKDAWAAVEVLSKFGLTNLGRAHSNFNAKVISMLHHRFSKLYTNPLISQFSSSLAATPRAHLATLSPELREKEEANRVARQRPLLRVCSELALVGIISDAAGKSGGEWIMKALKELVCVLRNLSDWEFSKYCY